MIIFNNIKRQYIYILLTIPVAGFKFLLFTISSVPPELQGSLHWGNAGRSVKLVFPTKIGVKYSWSLNYTHVFMALRLRNGLCNLNFVGN
jgi:hypothetical protein